MGEQKVGGIYKALIFNMEAEINYWAYAGLLGWHDFYMEGL